MAGGGLTGMDGAIDAGSIGEVAGVDGLSGIADAAAGGTLGPPIEFIRVERQGCVAASGEPDALPVNGFLWIDVHAGSGRQWAAVVARLTGIEIFEEHLRDSENSTHPSFYDSTARYEMIVMRALGSKPPAPAGRIRIDTRPAVFFVLPRCLVTIRPADNPLVPAVRERLLGAARYNQRIPTQPEELLLRLLSGMVDRYLELRQPLTAQLESWQRNLLHPRRPFKDWSTLLEARMQLRKLQHLCEEQLDAVQEWRDERVEHDEPGDTPALSPISDALHVRATDLVEHIQRVLNHARSLESGVESAVQLHFSATAFRTAEIMRVLTVLTAIFMPLTLITGIFGMNFDALPGIHSPRGFWITIGAMALLALVMLGWFLTQKYLGSPERTLRGRSRAADPEPESQEALPSAAAGSSGRSISSM
ncbi:MAG: magnesium transporter CorA family protein [Lautropia sp.]